MRGTWRERWSRLDLRGRLLDRLSIASPVGIEPEDADADADEERRRLAEASARLEYRTRTQRGVGWFPQDGPP